MSRSSRKVPGTIFAIFSVIFVTTAVFYVLPSSNELTIYESKEKESVLIFAATKFFGLDMAATPGAFVEVCPKDIQNYCRVTSDINEYKNAHAVLYHQPEYVPERDKYRYDPSQIQVMFSLESPHHYAIKFQPGFINWTMTYRMDSDIPFPYAILKKKIDANPINLENIWLEKNHTLTAAWMVTNCDAPNRRKEIVEQLQEKGFAIDILGSCGKHLEGCDRMADDRYDCAAKVLRKYKFYLALENTNCQDYVTEKFYNAMGRYNAIPIVIRRKYYENIGIPPNTFIAIDDFKSLSDMVKFLTNLKGNSVEYLKYHEWRNQYEVAEYDRSTGFCKLCESLKPPVRQTRNYVDLQNWFTKDICNNSYADSYLEK